MFVTTVVEDTIDEDVVKCKFEYDLSSNGNLLIAFGSAREEGTKYYLGHGRTR
jgi:hypothetical protein